MFNLYTWGFLRLWGEMGRFPTLRDSTPSPPPAPTLIHGAAANRVHVLARRPLISLSRTRLLYSFSSPPPSRVWVRGLPTLCQPRPGAHPET